MPNISSVNWVWFQIYYATVEYNAFKKKRSLSTQWDQTNTQSYN